MNFESKGMTFKDLNIHENTIKLEDTTSHIVHYNNAAGGFRLVAGSVAPCEFPPTPSTHRRRIMGGALYRGYIYIYTHTYTYC